MSRRLCVVNVASTNPKVKDAVRVFDNLDEAQRFAAKAKALGLVVTCWEL